MGGAGLIVLDTCAIIWLVLQPKSLSRTATQSIESAFKKNTVYSSTISYWEIAQAISRGMVVVEGGFKEFIAVMDGYFSITPVDITPEITELGVSLPSDINSDPADRIIAATSMILKAPLVTADKNLRKSKLIETIW